MPTEQEETLAQADAILDSLRRNVFISHISPESEIAKVLKKYLLTAFRSEFFVFVSSDQTSIGGGPEWFQHILANLGLARVVLVLLSHESSTEEWINFEAGVGRGQNSTIIPIAIRNFTFNKLKFPLAGFNGRTIGDIEGIIYDVALATNRTAERVDGASYRAELLEAENAVTHKSLVVTPFLRAHGDVTLFFALQNLGNIDMDLLRLDVWVPVQLFTPSGHPAHAENIHEMNIEEVDGVSCRHIYYSSIVLPTASRITSLRPVLTRSMGRIERKRTTNPC